VTARDSAQPPPQPGTDRTGAEGPSAKGRAAKGPGAKGPGEERPAYEQARDELTELVKRLEAGGLTLEQSLALWERGERLAVICEEWLEGARARLAAAMARRGDESDAGAAPF
jgi:exodeoxyribonuclease VII small subunit